MTFDTIVRNGRWFDAVTPDDLDESGCPQVIDATGKWVLPGLVDIHTHYDVEVLTAPRSRIAAEADVEQFGAMSRMVNRNDDTVKAVSVGGNAVTAAKVELAHAG